MNKLLATLLISAAVLSTPVEASILNSRECVWIPVHFGKDIFFITHSVDSVRINPRLRISYLPKPSGVMKKLIRHKRGHHIYSGTVLGNYDPKIYVNSDYPKWVQNLNIKYHEEALLKGCKDDAQDYKLQIFKKE